MRILDAACSFALLVATPVMAQTVPVYNMDADVSPLETLWQLRSALNVAALSCRDRDEHITVSSYNALLIRQQAILAAASDAVTRRYHAQFGPRWEVAREADMTRLYNYFANVDGKGSFCASAKQVLQQMAGVDATDLPGFATVALPLLKAAVNPASYYPTEQLASTPILRSNQDSIEDAAAAAPSDSSAPVAAAVLVQPVPPADEIPAALPAPVPPAPAVLADADLPPQALPAPIPPAPVPEPVKLSALFRPAPPQP